MTATELLADVGTLRYAIRDRLKTRFTDEELLMHVNEALRKVARDTRFFVGFSRMRVIAHKDTYKLDYRILKVRSVYMEGCKVDIRGATEPCKRTSTNTIDFVTLSEESRSLTIVPTLTAPLYKPTDFDKIIVDNNLETADDLGIPLYIDAEGNVSPILGVSETYKELVLVSEYFPVVELGKELPDSVIDILELIVLAVVVSVNANSTIREASHIYAEAYKNYEHTKKSFKKLAADKYLEVEYSIAYRTPFNKPNKRKRDF